MNNNFDLLTTVEEGGCSAKLPAAKLQDLLQHLSLPEHPNLLVGVDTHDDAGVYKINDTTALIQTTDFFPPLCSDAYEFGQIAAANAISDVYAMGGEVLTALNIILFPSDKIPAEVYVEILKGGLQKVQEAGGLIVGGHTIEAYPPTYGLSLTGTVHPEKIISNAGASLGEILILTKPLGTGIIVSGKRMNLAKEEDYRIALNTMKRLNKNAAGIMQKYKVRSATDVTGFGLIGHALKLANSSNVSIRLHSKSIPYLEGAYELADMGCIPGAAFRNQEYSEASTLFDTAVDYNHKMLMLDAQTSGGILMCVKPEYVSAVLQKLKEGGDLLSVVIGEVLVKAEKAIYVD